MTYSFSQKGFVPVFLLLLVGGIIGGGAATVKASRSSLPGDTLYSIKQVGDSFRVVITSQEKRPELYLQLASEKLDEVEKLEAFGRGSDKISEALKLYQFYQQKAGELAKDSQVFPPNAEDFKGKLEETSQKQKKVLEKVSARASEKADQVLQNVVNDTKKQSEETKKESEKVSQQVSQDSTTGSNNSSSYQTPPSASNTVVSTPSPLPRPSGLPTPAPVATPTPVAAPSVQNAILEVFAKDRAESPNNDLYLGIIRVKNPVSGAVIASGEMRTPGYLRLENITPGTYDVVLLKPASWNSDTCGQKVSVTLTAGQTQRAYMRLSGIAVSGYPCVRD